jgi:hypothetical protein
MEAWAIWDLSTKGYGVSLLRFHSSYEDISSYIEERDDLIYYDDDEFLDAFIKKYLMVKTELEDVNLPTKKRLNENEKKVGYALVEILENWERAFQSMEGGSKYNKIRF